jgi:hypothetical protein
MADLARKLRELEIATSDAFAFRQREDVTSVLALLRREEWERLEAVDGRALAYLFGHPIPKTRPRG